MNVIDVFVQGEDIEDIKHIRIEADKTVAELKAAVSGLRCSPVEGDTLIYIEDAEEPLVEDACIPHAKEGCLRVHVHRCHRIHVLVNYAGDTVDRDFGPGITIASIKRWAVRELELPKEDAGEHVLQISGTQTRPDSDTHVGSLVTCPECGITFDLVANERVNGGC